MKFFFCCFPRNMGVPWAWTHSLSDSVSGKCEKWQIVIEMGSPNGFGDREEHCLVHILLEKKPNDK